MALGKMVGKGAETSMIPRLDLCNGPACSFCGCRDAEILSTPHGDSWWDAGRARCRHCGREYAFRELPPEPPPYVPPIVERPVPAEGLSCTAPILVQSAAARVLPNVKCSKCGSPMKVASTLKTIRKYKCPQCGATAKRPK